MSAVSKLSWGNVQIFSDGLTSKQIITKIIRQKVPEDPLFVCSIDELQKQYEIWNKLMPRVKPYYAVKCNDNPAILELLAAFGASYDCATPAEVDAVRKIGVDPTRIIYANPTKKPTDLQFALRMGITETVFDNAAELVKIKKIHPKCKLLMRLRIDDAKAKCPFGVKYGVPVDGDGGCAEATELLRAAKDLGLNVVGLCFHVGSGCVTTSVYQDGIRICFELFQFAKNELGVQMNVLDIGGGQMKSTVVEIAKVVNVALDKYFPTAAAEGCGGIDIRAEPGRYFVESVFSLITQVHSVREIQREGKTSFMYYITDGVYGGLCNILNDDAIPIPRPVKAKGTGEVVGVNELYSCSIWGPTLDSLDQVSADVQLPQLCIGDWIYFENMGAYTLVCGTTFNGLPKPKICYVSSSSAWKVVRQRIAEKNAAIASGGAGGGSLSLSPRPATAWKKRLSLDQAAGHGQRRLSNFTGQKYESPFGHFYHGFK